MLQLVNYKDIEYVYFNERDIEIPALFESVKIDLHNIDSLLDVGASFSYTYYAAQLKEILGSKRKYVGIDLQSCKNTEAIVDEYYKSDILEFFKKPFSYISCVSTIEHCGLTGTKGSGFDQAIQAKIFSKLLDLGKYKIFLTFPFGLDNVFSGQYANISDGILNNWQDIAVRRGWEISVENYWFNEFPQCRKKWFQISRKEAANKPMIKERGVQCVCLAEFLRSQK